MDLYTPAEIVEDLESFEGIKLQTPFAEEATGRLWFLQKYSEVFDTRLPGSASTDHVRKRILAFLNAERLAIPQHDIAPVTDYPFCMYRLEPGERLSESVMYFQGGVRSIEQATERLEAESPAHWCIVDTENREALYLARTQH